MKQFKQIKKLMIQTKIWLFNLQMIIKKKTKKSYK